QHLRPSPPRPAFPFFFHDTAPTEIYTLSLHDALPITMTHNVVGITFERILWKIFLHPTIKHFVQIKIRQQRANDAALWCSFFCLPDVTGWHLHTRRDPTFDIEFAPWVIHCLCNKLL